MEGLKKIPINGSIGHGFTDYSIVDSTYFLGVRTSRLLTRGHEVALQTINNKLLNAYRIGGQVVLMKYMYYSGGLWKG